MTEIQIICERICRGGIYSGPSKKRVVAPRGRGIHRPREVRQLCSCGAPTKACGVTCEAPACRKERYLEWQRARRARIRREREALYGPIKFGPKPC